MAVEFIGPAAFVCSVAGALLSNFAGAWLAGLILAAAATVLVRREVNGAALRRYHDRFIEPTALDAACRLLLCRTQHAIKSVLASKVFEDGQLGLASDAAVLRQHEWEIAVQLRELTKFQAEHEVNRRDNALGPQTALVLDGQLRALTIARDATTRRVEKLEHYAARVGAADAARRDWRQAHMLSARNDDYRDLAARMAADEHAIIEITSLTDRAAAAEAVYRDALHQASLAAEALAFPDQPTTRAA